MIKMFDTSLDRQQLTHEDFRQRAYYLLSHPPLDTSDLATWFLVAYEQGIQDCMDGIVKPNNGQTEESQNG